MTKQTQEEWIADFKKKMNEPLKRFILDLGDHEYTIRMSLHPDYKEFYNWYNENRIKETALAEEYTDFPRQWIKFSDFEKEAQMRELFKDNL